MGKENVFPLRKDKGIMKNNKKKIWKDESKKSDERRMKEKWKNTKSEIHKKVFFCNEISNWSKWKIHKKDTKNREWKEEENFKTKKQRKIREDHPKKTFKKRYSI